MILAHHAAFASGLMYNRTWGPLFENLRVGMPLFFVISGFLLYRPFVAERYGGPPAPRIRDFARRRAVRILPGYWVALTVLAIYPGLFGVFTDQWWAFYGLLQVYPIFDPPAGCAAAFQFCGITQAWSLSAEVSFYAALPLYVIFGRRLFGSRSRRAKLTLDLIVLALLAAASVFAFGFSLTHPPQIWVGFSLPGTFVWFACGMALAVLSAAFHGRRMLLDRIPGAAAWAMAAAIFFAVAYLVMPSSLLDPRTRAELIVQWVGFAAVSTLIVLPAAFGDADVGVTRRILRTPALAWIGLISYGIYLYHLAVVLKLHEWGGLGSHFATLTLLALAITIPIAALSYYLLELPLMKRLK
jgi:peptidoglycan/LPS O-acetylase OafA/YrhL